MIREMINEEAPQDYADPDDFYRTFIAPAKVSMNAIIGSIGQVTSKAKTAIQVSLDAIASTIVPWYKSKYHTIKEKDKKRSLEIVKQYREFFEKVDESLGEKSDFKVLMFAASPGPYMAHVLLKYSQKGGDGRVVFKTLFGMDLSSDIDAQHLDDVAGKIDNTEIAKRVKGKYVQSLREDIGEIDRIVSDTNAVLKCSTVKDALDRLSRYERMGKMDVKEFKNLPAEDRDKVEPAVLQMLKYRIRAETLSLLRMRMNDNRDVKELRERYSEAINSIVKI